jgi:hypothetical protein
MSGYYGYGFYDEEETGGITTGGLLTGGADEDNLFESTFIFEIKFRTLISLFFLEAHFLDPINTLLSLSYGRNKCPVNKNFLFEFC